MTPTLTPTITPAPSPLSFDIMRYDSSWQLGSGENSIAINVNLNGSETWSKNYTIKYIGSNDNMSVDFDITSEDGITSTIEESGSPITNLILVRNVEYTLTLKHVADKYLKSGSYNLTMVVS